MKKIINLFTQHPHSVGETYLEHLRFASCGGLRLALSGIACMIHSVFPFIFIDTASNTIKSMHQKITERSKDS